MDIFRNTLDIIPKLTRRLLDLGWYTNSGMVNGQKKDLICREEIGYSFLLLNWDDRDAMLESNGLSKEFCEQDFTDRISTTPLNPGTSIEYDTSGALKPFLDDRGKLSYTYSERLYYQYTRIIKLLREDPDTRQAYMSVWDTAKDIQKIGSGRVPCSLGYHFLIREGSLIMIYNMRSLEVTKCLGNDIYTATKMIEYIGDAIDIKPGYIQFNIGSMHVFVEGTSNSEIDKEVLAIRRLLRSS